MLMVDIYYSTYCLVALSCKVSSKSGTLYITHSLPSLTMSKDRQHSMNACMHITTTLVVKVEDMSEFYNICANVPIVYYYYHLYKGN